MACMSSSSGAAARGAARPRAARGAAARRWLRAAGAPRRCAPAAAAADAWSSLPQVAAVLGSQWGDEGKGKLVDILAQEYDLVCRAQGGANAGHTIYDSEGNKYALHLVPSGILNPEATCLVGNGVVVHLPGFFEEIEKLEEAGVKTQGRLLVSDRAHLLFDLHKEIDGLREAELKGGKIGTTKRGIGPAYASKSTRNGLRVCDLADMDAFKAKFEALVADARARFGDALEYDTEAELANYERLAERIAPYITDTVAYVNNAHKEGKRILVEGANATMLDVDFGTYPFVTSSNPSVGGVISGLGLAPNKISCLVGVAKAYTTRVGAGPYPTEVFGDLADDLRAEGFEYGTTTGRPRRIGWLDVPALKYACDINGFTAINITKLDVLSKLEKLQICVGYEYADGTPCPSLPASVSDLERVVPVYEEVDGWLEDISGAREWSELPEKAQAYVLKVEELVGVPCTYIGVGPGRDAMIVKP